MENPTDQDLKEILSTYRRIAVIGLSPVAARPSYGVTRYMINHGYEIYGVRPASPPQILGRPCVESLKDLKADVQIFDVFRNSDALPGLIDEIEAWMTNQSTDKKPRVLWLQEGVSHRDAEEHARRIGLTVVVNRCILKDHARLIGS